MKERYPWITSDWECTKFPEGNWHKCCVKHDWDYAEGRNKWAADSALALCVLKQWHPLVALAMWVGVTVGGWKPYYEHKEARERKALG